jgi:AraC-like DNA-binding protein
MHYRDIVVANGDPVEIAEKSEEEKALDEEEKRFKQMDKRVMKEELFRAPDFGRDELMRLMGVDKNAISVIISRYTGMNVTGYVNTKRMEYAVLLMRQHPEYTMGAIAEACGIKSPATFIRNFRNVYGMTPSEFRQNIDE